MKKSKNIIVDPKITEDTDVQNIIYRYLRDSVNFEGDAEIVDEKIRELSLGLYKIFCEMRVKYPLD